MSLVLQSDLLLGVLRAAPAAGSSAAARKLGVASSDAGEFARTLPPHESSGASDLIMGVLSAGSPERRQAAAAVLKAADTVETESRQDKAYAGLEATLARNLFEAAVANHATRIVTLPTPGESELTTLVAADIPSTLDP